MRMAADISFRFVKCKKNFHDLLRIVNKTPNLLTEIFNLPFTILNKRVSGRDF